jgi:hypothetical protein
MTPRPVESRRNHLKTQRLVGSRQPTTIMLLVINQQRQQLEWEPTPAEQQTQWKLHVAYTNMNRAKTPLDRQGNARNLTKRC